MDELSISAAHGTIQPFRAGAALGETFDVLMKRLPLLLCISAVANLPLLFAHYQLGVTPGSTRLGDLMVVSLLDGLWAGVYQAMTVVVILRHLAGRPPGFVTAARQVLVRFVPVTAASLLTAVIVCAGLILLVMPGLIAGIALTVTVQACVVEGIGPWKSISRSYALTKGRKGEVFVALLPVSVIAGGVTAVMRPSAPQNASAALVAGLYGLNVLSWAYFGVLSSIIYRDLRAEKEGVSTDQIAAAFD